MTSPLAPPRPADTARLAITIGDVAGIGPEIVARTLALRARSGGGDEARDDDPDVSPGPADLVVFGPWPCVQQAFDRWAPDVELRRLIAADVRPPAHPDASVPAPALHPEAMPRQAGATKRIDVVDVGDDSAALASLEMGRIDPRAGRAAFQAIEAAIAWANAGWVDGLCTAPIHKESLAAAGVPYPGHTEMLATLGHSPDTAMMLVNRELRTMLVTIHCSMREAIERIDRGRVLRIIRLAHRTLVEQGIASPRIAVAGLNPHAGEGGLFGREDVDIIAPAIADAVAQGIDASGPHPGDTVFMRARKGQFDLVVAQYHDQGLIPIKLMGVDDGVNITAGLAFVRTSPDHGTAFDIAGHGVADPSSFALALRMAEDWVATRRSRAAARPGVAGASANW